MLFQENRGGMQLELQSFIKHAYFEEIGTELPAWCIPGTYDHVKCLNETIPVFAVSQ